MNIETWSDWPFLTFGTCFDFLDTEIGSLRMLFVKKSD